MRQGTLSTQQQQQQTNHHGRQNVHNGIKQQQGVQHHQPNVVSHATNSTTVMAPMNLQLHQQHQQQQQSLLTHHHQQSQPIQTKPYSTPHQSQLHKPPQQPSHLNHQQKAPRQRNILHPKSDCKFNIFPFLI